MIELQVSDFDDIWKIMKEAFPIAERRSYVEQKRLFERDDYHVYGIKEQNQLMAFISVYEMELVRFVEHLATDQALRGSGVGKILFQEMLDLDDHYTILEVEKPDDEMAIRRIGFYQRLGGHLYEDVDYVQPPFHEGLQPLPLLLMSWPKRLEEELVEQIKHALYTKIYRWKR